MKEARGCLEEIRGPFAKNEPEQCGDMEVRLDSRKNNEERQVIL